jgi:hypothetical protein
MRTTYLKGFLVSSSLEVIGYILPFRAKTARFCGLDSWHAKTVPVACVLMKLVRYHCSTMRSTSLEGFLVLSSLELIGYVLGFHAKTARFCGSDYRHAETVPVASVRTKLVR